MAYGYRRSRRGGSASRQRGPGRGQGPMRAMYSGALPVIRHSVEVTSTAASYGNIELEDAKAQAIPLCVFFGTSSATNNASVTPTTSEGSRVNHVLTNLSITQSDTSKPNQCYVGLISTSFSDAMLNAANMTSNFADLIAVSNETTGLMVPFNGAKSLNYNDWSASPFLRHWIRGFQRNTYTLYSGRPAVINSVIPMPRKNRRQQFGSGLWLVVMNDSSGMQNVVEGSASSVHVSLRTSFKEIPPIKTDET